MPKYQNNLFLLYSHLQAKKYNFLRFHFLKYTHFLLIRKFQFFEFWGQLLKNILLPVSDIFFFTLLSFIAVEGANISATSIGVKSKNFFSIGLHTTNKSG